MNKQELTEILSNHQEWLRDSSKGKRANIYRANLYYANLSGANLSYANLSYANFYNANLSDANISDANLLSATLPSPSEVLLANWGELSDDLTQKAMAYDAFFHQDPSSFDRWNETGECPYSDVKYQRACNFREKAELWDPTIPCPRGFDLMVEIIKEKCADSDWH
jgi:hypothetical protein